MTLAFTIAALTLTSAALLAYIAFAILSYRASGRVLRRLDELKEYLDEEVFEPDDSSN